MISAKQSGVALITVLIILALITPIITHVAVNQRLSVSRTTLLDQSNKAMTYALSVETWGRDILLRDRKLSEHDDLSELWNQPLPLTLSDKAKITSDMSDLQGKLNINLLAENNPQFKAAWLELLANLEIDESLAEQVTNAIADWVDEDDEVRLPGGSEDRDYISQKASYLAANQPMSHLSELRLIRGVPIEVWESIQPFVTALPETNIENSKINVNTAPFEVLQAILPDQASAMLEEYQASRSEIIFTNLDEFKAFYLSSVGDELNSNIEPMLDVKSQYFELNTDVSLGDQEIHLRSFLKRSDNEQTQVMYREIG